jgi:predicted nucleic acid-binding protein
VFVCPQNLIEFWSVATRPSSANGFGFTPTRAATELDRIERLFPLIDETPAIYPQWRQLVRTAGVCGRQAFDARIAAIMLTHGTVRILTFNVEDFRRYPGIIVIDPQDIPEPTPQR